MNSLKLCVSMKLTSKGKQVHAKWQLLNMNILFSYSNAIRALKERSSKKTANQFGPKSRQFVNPKQVRTYVRSSMYVHMYVHVQPPVIELSS